MPDSIKYVLTEDQMPKFWYNIVADLPAHPPAPLHPGTGQPISPSDLSAIFPAPIIEQEMSAERDIEIPREVRDIYRQWRPSPLYRARRLEKALDTPAKIYYKYEGVSPAGSHKTNSAFPQAFYNKISGIKRLITETGAGQWGSSLSMAAEAFGLECLVYMVKVSFSQKPYRRALMETFGAKVIASPSDTTDCGRKILADSPDSSGSLGMAISEAVEIAAHDPNASYCLGSVLNHVLLHQTIIGLETKIQLEMAEAQPDLLIGCTGGGSNFAGLVFPFLKEKLHGGSGPRVIAVEPKACPSLTKGHYAYDYGDVSKLTPLVKMNTLGSSFVPPGFHAGGLRYHGMAPLVSQVLQHGAIEATSVDQLEVFQSAVQFARAECIVPAPESSHAVAVAIQEANRCKEHGVSKNIVFNLSGHGHFDMQAYTDFFAGKLVNYAYPEQEIAMALSSLPSV